MNCHKCGSDKITYYKQRRKDAVWVVTARCDRGHIPQKGHPFYSVWRFDISKLPILPNTETLQEELFKLPKAVETPPTLIDYIEQKRNRRFPA